MAESTQSEVTEIELLAEKEYEYGFVTEVEQERIPKGLSEETVRLISAKKEEPEWLLEWRLKAYRRFLQMLEEDHEPTWANVSFPEIDYQDMYYYAAPKPRRSSSRAWMKSIPSCSTPTRQARNPAGRTRNAWLASRSRSTRCSTAFPLRRRTKPSSRNTASSFVRFPRRSKTIPDLDQASILGSVVPLFRQLFRGTQLRRILATGRFAFIPKGVRCPMELSTYFRINAQETGQFERTLIVAEDNAYVSYLEGCTAPMRDENQLHAAVVELVALEEAEIKYSTVQNWYPGRQERQRRHLQLRDEARQACRRSSLQDQLGPRSRQVRPSRGSTRAASCKAMNRLASSIQRRHDQRTSQQADTGTKMLHIGKNTKSVRSSRKGISVRATDNRAYRGLVRIGPKAANGARNYSAVRFAVCIGDQLRRSHLSRTWK